MTRWLLFGRVARASSPEIADGYAGFGFAGGDFDCDRAFGCAFDAHAAPYELVMICLYAGHVGGCGVDKVRTGRHRHAV